MKRVKDSISVFRFGDGVVFCSPFYAAYISQLIRFIRVYFDINDFKNSTQLFNAKLQNKVTAIINFVKHFLFNSTTDTQS